MIPILQLLNKSIQQSIPLPEIFQYMDTKTTTLLFNNCFQEYQILAYLNKLLPKSTSTDSISINFDKMNLIHQLISTIYHKRFQLNKRLINFKENNKELIQLLQTSNRQDTLLLIGQFESQYNLFTNSEVVWWQEIKLSYVKASLINIFNNGTIFPEFLYGVNYNETISQYEIQLNKKMVKTMKIKHLFTQAVKQEIIEDQRLIAGLLRTIKLQDIPNDIQDKIESFQQKIRELRLKDEVSVQLLKMTSTKKQSIENLQQQTLRKKGIKLIIPIYLQYALTTQLPIPEFIFSLSIQDSNTFIPHIRLLEGLKQNYPSLKLLSEQLRMYDFFDLNCFIKQADYDRIQEYFESRRICGQNYYKQLFAMIKLIYLKAEKIQESIFSIRNDKRFQEIAIFYQKINNRATNNINQSYYYKCLEYVYKIYCKFDYILNESGDEMPTQNNCQNVTSKKVYKYKIMKNNQIKLFKLLVSLGKPHPELIKAIHFIKRNVKSNQTIKQHLSISIKTGLWLMPVIFENESILQVLTKIYQETKQQLLSRDEVQQIFIEEELPDILLGADMNKITLQQAIMKLIILFYYNYKNLEGKLKQTFTLRIFNDFEEYLKVNVNSQQLQEEIQIFSKCLQLLKERLCKPLQIQQIIDD